MTFNDAFGLFGHYAFSSKPTHGRSIYQALVDGIGNSYNTDFSSLESARLYATAICLASIQYQIDRAYNNRDVNKATELLTQLEHDFQVTPGPNDTLKQRRDYLSSLVKISRGNSRSAVESALNTLLGDSFVSYEQHGQTTFPTSPGSVGVFSKSYPLKIFTVGSSVSTVGQPVSVQISPVGDSSMPQPGERYTIDPDPRGNIEQITVDAVDGDHITTTFSKSHESGTMAITPYPIWASFARYSTITVSSSVASDQETRRKINELMSRAARGVSQWDIVSDAGSFILGDPSRGILGSTALA